MKVGVNGAVRDISDLKVGANGAVRAVSEAYIGVNGAVKKVWPTYSIVKTEHIDKYLSVYSRDNELYTITNTPWSWDYTGGVVPVTELSGGPIYVYTRNFYSETDVYLNGDKLSIRNAELNYTIENGSGYDKYSWGVSTGLGGNIALFAGFSGVKANSFDVVYRFQISGVNEGYETGAIVIGGSKKTSTLKFTTNFGNPKRVICDKYIVQS